MVSTKIDLLVTWVILGVATISEVPLWLKIASYIIGILVGFTALVKFYWDWKDRMKNKG